MFFGGRDHLPFSVWHILKNYDIVANNIGSSHLNDNFVLLYIFLVESCSSYVGHWKIGHLNDKAYSSWSYEMALFTFV